MHELLHILNIIWQEKKVVFSFTGPDVRYTSIFTPSRRNAKGHRCRDVRQEESAQHRVRSTQNTTMSNEAPCSFFGKLLWTINPNSSCWNIQVTEEKHLHRVTEILSPSKQFLLVGSLWGSRSLMLIILVGRVYLLRRREEGRWSWTQRVNFCMPCGPYQSNSFRD